MLPLSGAGRTGPTHIWVSRRCTHIVTRHTQFLACIVCAAVGPRRSVGSCTALEEISEGRHRSGRSTEKLSTITATGIVETPRGSRPCGPKGGGEGRLSTAAVVAAPHRREPWALSARSPPIWTSLSSSLTWPARASTRGSSAERSSAGGFRRAGGWCARLRPLPPVGATGRQTIRRPDRRAGDLPRGTRVLDNGPGERRADPQTSRRLRQHEDVAVETDRLPEWAGESGGLTGRCATTTNLVGVPRCRRPAAAICSRSPIASGDIGTGRIRCGAGVGLRPRLKAPSGG